MSFAPSPSPSNASGGFAGQTSAYGFQTLPSTGLAREHVRLVTGAITRALNLIAIPSLGVGFGFSLSNNSQDSYQGPVGHNWRHNYQMELDVSVSLVTYSSGDGQQVDFISDGSGGWTIDTSTSLYSTLELTNPSGTLWEIQDAPGGTVWTFDATALSGYPETAGRLTSITDRKGNTVTLNYTAGKLTSIQEPQGRTMTLAYTGSLLTSVTDPKSNTTLLTYDNWDNLLTVSGPEGCTVTFGYANATDHLISSITDARGNTTRYEYIGDRIQQVVFPDGNTLRYGYLWDDQAPFENTGNHGTGLTHNATQLIMPGGEVTEYRFDLNGNLWRVILPSGNIKRYFWNSKQRFLYCSEGRPMLGPNNNHGPADNIHNRYTRCTVNERGDTIAALDPTGIMDTFEYDAESRLLVHHPGQVHYGVQGNWPESYGEDGYLLCAFESDGSDVYQAPAYLDSSVATAITNGDGLGGDLYTRINKNGTNLLDPRSPVRGPDSLQRGIGFWRHDGANALGASFQFSINLNQAKAFNLSLYSHSSDMGAYGNSRPLKYNGEFGRDVKIEVEDLHGVQSFRMHNNAPGVWTTFPVEGDVSNPIKITVTATGSNVEPVISALAFSPYHDRRTFREYTDGLLTKVTNALGEETTYTYNTDGTMATITDARNNTTTFSYLDTHKNLTQITDADSNSTTLTYDDNGNVLTMTDANLNVTTMTYDGKNRLLTVTDPLTRVTTFDYDGNGNRLSITDPMNRVTSFTYTASNQLETIENELGHVVRFTYDVNGRQKTITDPRGLVTSFDYNEDGNLIETKLPDGEKVSYSIDALNQVVALTGPNGNQESLELMNLLGAGNLFRNPGIETADPNWPDGADNWYGSDGTRQRHFTHVNSGQASLPLPTTGVSLVQEDLALPEGAKFVAQAKFRRSEQALVLGAKVRDSQGTLLETSVSQALSDEHEAWVESPLLGFQVPGDSHTTASNLSLKEFTARVDSTGDVVGWLDDLQLNMVSEAYHHDKTGRLKYTTSPTGARTVLHRDRMGRLVATEDPAGERVEMTYDALDRVVAITKPSGETLSLTYNEVGSLDSFTDGRSKTTSFVYDVLNRLTSIVYPDTSSEIFTYDPVGNLDTYTDIAGQSKSFTYDDADRLTTITYTGDSSTVSFTYDDANNMLTQTERNGDVLSYTYDDIDRLTSVYRTPGLGNSTPSWAFSYTYDANGNRLSCTDGASNELWRVDSSAEARYGTALYNTGRYKGRYDAGNRPLSYWVDETLHAAFQYDPEGRRTGIDFANGTSGSVTFDIVGRPLEFNTSNSSSSLLSVKYGYDIRSNRTSQLTGNDTFDYLLDEDGKLTGEAVNRMVTVGRNGFSSGELEGLTLSATGLELLPLDDSWTGDQINCDRWRISALAKDGTGNILSPDNFLGPEVRQQDGLHFVFPRGYHNRIYKRDELHPLNDEFGLRIETHRFIAEHRQQLIGDFDVQVDFSEFQANTTTASSPIELYVSEDPLDQGGTQYFSIGRFRVSYRRYFAGTAVYNSTTDNSGKLRLVRSGTSITAYVWNSSTSTWTTYGNWTQTFTDAPLWVGLSAETSTSTVSVTFKNFLFNAGVSTHAQMGTFTSPVYDAGRNVSWQNLSWSETLSGTSDLEFQVAFSDSKDGPWNYIGPDGTAGTRFTDPSGESVGASIISRYCRYKAFLSGDGSVTPILDSVELSYSGSLDSQLRTFAFDAAGNITKKVVKSDTSTVEETRIYNDLNEIAENSIDDGSTVATWTFTHDPNGNMTSKTDGVDTYTYSWSEDNQLLGVELNSSPVVSYEYDSGSRMLQRIEGSISTNYHWDGWDLVREEKDDGVGTEITNYLVPQGEVLAFQRDGDWFYLHGDGLSSTQLVTDESGAQVGRAVYGAWGETLSFNESVPGSLDVRFVGGLGVRNDAATGLIYMRHRWYDSELGRFISRDPIGLAGDTNVYRYGANNPVTFFDSMGLQHKKGSPAWCAGLAAKIKNIRDAIEYKIEAMNNNGTVTRGPDKGMPRRPLPYDDPTCPGDGRNTILGHLNDTQALYDNLGRNLRLWRDWCGPKPPWMTANFTALNPKWAPGDNTKPTIVYLPTAPWNSSGGPAVNEPGLDLYILPLMLLSPLRVRPRAAPSSAPPRSAPGGWKKAS